VTLEAVGVCIKRLYEVVVVKPKTPPR
jgi:hypothetical protein